MRGIRDGLKDIFFSKVDPQRREAAFHLSATLCELFGLDWVAGKDCDTKFLLLWLHLVAVVGYELYVAMKFVYTTTIISHILLIPDYHFYF